MKCFENSYTVHLGSYIRMNTATQYLFAKVALLWYNNALLSTWSRDLLWMHIKGSYLNRLMSTLMIVLAGRMAYHIISFCHSLEKVHIPCIPITSLLTRLQLTSPSLPLLWKHRRLNCCCRVLYHSSMPLQYDHQVQLSGSQFSSSSMSMI